MSDLNNIEKLLFFLLILFLPTQLGYHFWPQFSYLNGLRIDYLAPTIYLTDIILLFLTAVNLAKYRHETTTFIRKNTKILIVCCLIIIICVIRLYYSLNFLAGIYAVFKIFEISLLVFIAKRFFRRGESITPFVACLASSVIFEVVLSIFQLQQQGSIGNIFYLFGERYFTSETPGIANASIEGVLVLRPYATFPHPNVLAGFLLIAQTLLINYLKHFKSKIKNLIIFTAAISFIGIVLTLSRVAILLEILIFIFYISEFLKTKNSIKLKLFVLLGYALLLTNVLIIFLPRLFSTSINENAFVERIELTKVSIALLLANPILGVGLNNFLNVLSQVKNTSAPLQPTHNTPLLLAVELGLPVALLIILSFLILFRKVLISKTNVETNRKTCIILLIVIVILSLSDHYFRTLQQGQLMFALAIAFIIGSLKKPHPK